jgi:hypothetical protein
MKEMDSKKGSKGRGKHKPDDSEHFSMQKKKKY